MTEQVTKITRKRSGTDARQVKSRHALRTAMLSLLERKPLDEITIRDIAAESGVGYTTFFRHYPSKADLLNDIAADEIRNLIDLSMAGANSADMRAGSLVLCDYVQQHRALWSTLLTGGAAGVMREEFLRISREVAAEHGEWSGWVPRELGTILAVTTIVEIIAWWLSQPEDAGYSSAQMADMIYHLAIAPTLPGSRPARG